MKDADREGVGMGVWGGDGGRKMGLNKDSAERAGEKRERWRKGEREKGGMGG